MTSACLWKHAGGMNTNLPRDIPSLCIFGKSPKSNGERTERAFNIILTLSYQISEFNLLPQSTGIA